jgi:gluconate 2-dehydrogenase alpha chain
VSYLWLSADLAEIASALFERMFPADENGPGAAQIGVVAFVDRALSGEDRDKQELYRRGLRALDDEARARAGSGFASCDDQTRDALIGDLESGRLPSLPGRFQHELFATLLLHLREGLFSDPIHGGNIDFAGWRFLGHPGVHLNYTAEENLQREPVDKNGCFLGLQDLPPDPAPYPLPEHPRPEWATDADDESVDVVLVGVGLVGGLVAPTLAHAGLRVVGLEAGPWRHRGEYRPDELTYSVALRAKFSGKFADERPTWRPDEATPTVPAQASLGHMVNGVGGSAMHYGAMLRRYHPHHFAERSRAARVGGPDAIPEGCTIADWPLTYEDLEPFYERVEYLVGVSGGEGNPFVPRRGPFPMPPLRRFRMGESFRAAASGLGLHPYPCPVGINSEPYHGRPGVRYNSFELTLGDNVDAKWHPGLDCVPEALGTGNFDLRTGARVTRVLTGSNGEATGVVYRDEDGRERTVRARAVVLCAYALENMRLMFLSADERRPNGLGNSSDQLGRHTMSRMLCSVYGHVSNEHFNMHTGAVGQNILLEDFHADGFDSFAHGFLGGASIGTEQGAMPISVSRTALPPDVPAWGGAYKAHLRDWQQYAFIRIQEDALPYEDNRVELDPTRRDASGVGLPVLRITHRLHENEERLHQFMVERAEEILRQMGATRTWSGPSYTGVLSSHELGGCRMGHDPAASVVDDTLEVHDTPGLFVFSGAAFPSGCAINPTLTLMAMSLRAGEALAQRLSGERSVAAVGTELTGD